MKCTECGSEKQAARMQCDSAGGGSPSRSTYIDVFVCTTCNPELTQKVRSRNKQAAERRQERSGGVSA